MRKRILAILFVLSGIFYYKTILPGHFHQSQISFFILCGGMMGALLLYEKNRWLGLIAGLASLMFLKSYLLLLGPKMKLFECSLIGFSMLCTYYASRHFKLKQDILKWFLVPAIINMVLILMQKFDSTASFLPVHGITGFLGSTGKTACFLALTAPLFLEYIPALFPVLLITLIVCKSSVALGMFVVSTLIYLKFKKKKIFRIVCLVFLIAFALYILNMSMSEAGFKWNKGNEFADLGQRLCFWFGTLDGIKHNPIFGWGIGNFESVWASIPSAETRYFDTYSCNYTATPATTKIMNHPHNELLLWTWYMGIGIPILFLGLCVGLIRKFSDTKILSFSMLAAAFVCLMGYFASYPTWLLIMVTLGIYENENDDG